MNMGQRTSSAAELAAGRSKENDQVFIDALREHPLNQDLEFSPASEPSAGVMYFKNGERTEHGNFVILDGFYIDSDGARKTFAALVSKDMVTGSYAEDKRVPSVLTRSGGEVYFVTREMAEYCVKKIQTTDCTHQHAILVCHARNHNSMVDFFEDAESAGHFEDGKVLVLNVDRSDSGSTFIRGLTEVLANKKLHLVHVVGEVDTAHHAIQPLKLLEPSDLKKPGYYTSEMVAGYGFQDRMAGRKSLDNLSGRTYDAIAQHLARSSK